MRCSQAHLPVAVVDIRAAHETVGQSGSMHEQILDPHRPLRARGQIVGMRPLLVDSQIAKLGDVGVDWIVELKESFFVEHHGRNGRDRLGH